MATCTEMFENDKTQNCIKCLYGMKLTRNAIVPLARDIMKRFRDDAKETAIRKNRLSESANCSSCSTKDVVPCGTWGICRYQKGNCRYHDVPPKQCPNKLCDEMFSYIMKHHRYGKPSWKNTDASAWCSNEWEVAKCFCPTDGYSDSKSAEKTDLNGILSIIQNCDQFEMYFDDIKKVEEVRRFCQSLRHSPDIQVTCQEMSEIFKALTNLLTDGKSLGSKPEAISTVSELKKLETNKLTVSSEEVGKLFVLEKGAMEDCKKALNEERDDDSVTLKDIVSRLDHVTQLLSVLGRQRPSKRPAKSDNGHLPKSVKRDRASYSSNVEGLLKDLCIFYDKYYSTLPLGPMFEEKVSKLEEVFVLPNLVQQRTETTNEKKRDEMFLSGRERFKVPIASVDEIFLRRHKQAKIVYIEGKAGFGKTSFCKFLIKLWCLKTGNALIVNKNETMFVDDQEYVNNSEILQNFKVLFYVPLRLVGVDIVNVDQMIFTHIIQNLENGDKCKISFVNRILKEEKCLIILDGLDEWKHPSNCHSCMKDNCCIPHCNYQNCTLLIASRPWKIAESHITVSEEDNCIAIQKMSVDSQKELIVKASNWLVKESYAVDASEFLEQVERQNIQNCLSNPLEIVQLLCIFHDEKILVDSRCKTYCQILNMLLGRAKKMFKMKLQDVSDESENISLPTCFIQDADMCQEHKSILLRLGKVAYTALKSTSTQVLDEATVSATFRGEEVSFILTAGLLSKGEQRGKLARQVCRYSFLHSSYQEFLCCLYLVCKNNGADLLSSLLDHLETTGQKDVLTEMFLFFCGMSGKLARRAHDKLSEMKNDQMKKCDRIRFLDVRKSRDLTLKGYEESKINGVENNIKMCQLVIDKHLDFHYPALQRNTTGIHSLACIWHKEISIEVKHMDLFIKNSSKSLVYVFINGEHGKTIQFTSQNLNTCQNLHTLELRYIQLTDKLDLSACETLKSLTITRVKLSEVCIYAPKLHYCFLRTVDERDALFHLSFSNDLRFSVNLKELTLMNVSVVGELDISECKHLTGICLWNVDMDKLILETLSVKTCFLGEHIGKNKSFWPIILNALTGSEKLEELYASGPDCSSLELFDALKTIKNVRDLQLIHVNCNDADMQLPKSLQNISLDEVILSFPAFTKLVESVRACSRSVQCSFHDCEINKTVPSTIENFIKETCIRPNYELEQTVFPSRNKPFRIPTSISAPGPKVNVNMNNVVFRTCK